MRLIRLCSAAVLTLTVPAWAQELPRWQPSDCASFAPNSLEAALLDCDEESVPSQQAEPVPEADLLPEWEDLDELEWSDLPAPDEALATIKADGAPVEGAAPRATATEVGETETGPDQDPVLPEAYEADLDERERLALPLVVEPRAPEDVEVLDDMEAERPDQAVVTEAQEPAMRVHSGAERTERRRERQRAREERRREREQERESRGNSVAIPPGYRPPPGECRLWFPDRPAGHQPPPTSCDVEVPMGSVLVRG